MVSGGFVGIVVLLMVFRSFLKRNREELSLRVLGVATKRARFPHAILNIREHKDVTTYINSLGRSSYRTFQKIDKSFAENRIEVQTTTYDGITWDHFSVIYDHESKVYGKPKGFAAACGRFFAISHMLGTIDNYYIDGKLVAFSSTIIKGDTLRAMWFYQRLEVSKFMIWFHGVRTAIHRALATPGVQFVDLGPSLNESVIQSKEKLYFKNTPNWNEVCNYSGPFKEPLAK